MVNKKGAMQMSLGFWVILAIMFLVAVGIFFVYRLITSSISFT